jgi:shikimate kinase
MAEIIRRTPTNLVLIGFMATGKSTVARALARGLGFESVDTDAIIARQAGKPIAGIFEDLGEEGFRGVESEVLQGLLTRERLVIATGGGIVTREENISDLRSLGMVIWLNASIDVIMTRVADNDERPLLQTDDPRKSVEELLEQRLDLYKKAADERIDIDNLSCDELAYGIAESARVWFAGSN